MANKKTSFKNIIQFIQDSFDDLITIMLWVVLWNILEPYLNSINLNYKLLLVFCIVIFLNKRLLKFPKPKKRYKKRKTTLKDIEEKIENISNRV